METYISFYLSSFRIHVFRKAITDIGELRALVGASMDLDNVKERRV